MNTPQWRKSSHSGNGGDTCVEVADLNGVTAVRDSVHPEHGYLSLSPDVFRTLVTVIKAGEFDR